MEGDASCFRRLDESPWVLGDIILRHQDDCVIWAATHRASGKKACIKMKTVAPGEGTEELTVVARLNTLGPPPPLVFNLLPPEIPAGDRQGSFGGTYWIAMTPFASTLQTMPHGELDIAVATTQLSVQLRSLFKCFGLFHCDVKGSNILYEAGVYALADFGLASAGGAYQQHAFLEKDWPYLVGVSGASALDPSAVSRRTDMRALGVSLALAENRETYDDWYGPGWRRRTPGHVEALRKVAVRHRTSPLMRAFFRALEAADDGDVHEEVVHAVRTASGRFAAAAAAAADARPPSPAFLAPDVAGPLIGIGGRMGAGKDTAAGFARERLLAVGGGRRPAGEIRVAATLKKIVATLAGLGDDVDAESREFKSLSPPRFGGVTVGRALQLLGGWARDTLSVGIWLTDAVGRIEAARADPGCFGVVVPDVRFADEAEAVARLGGVVWRVERPDAGAQAAVVSGDGRDAADPSERGYELPAGSTVVLNDGTLEELRAKVWALVDAECARAR